MPLLLFDGTQAVNAIINGTVSGFKPLLAGRATYALHGDGTYFASYASYSEAHVRDASDETDGDATPLFDAVSRALSPAPIK